MLSGLVWKDHEQQMALPSVRTAWCKEVKGSLWFLFIQILTQFCFSLIYLVVSFVGFFVLLMFIARFPFGMFSALCGWWVSTAQCVAARCCFVCVKASDSKMVSCVSEPAPCAGVSRGWTESLASPAPVRPAATRTTGRTGLWEGQGPAKAVKGRGERGWGDITLPVESWDCGP